jgi:hypothetical protein
VGIYPKVLTSIYAPTEIPMVFGVFLLPRNLNIVIAFIWLHAYSYLLA